MEILIYPKDELALRYKCHKIYHDIDLVKPIGTSIGSMPFLNDEVKNLSSVLLKSEGIGLASNQIGGHVRVFVMLRSIENRQTVCAFIDPVITPLKEYGRNVVSEGCLSLPFMRVSTARWNCISIKYVDVYGVLRQETLSYEESVCAQHEFDHLNGRLIIDTDFVS